MATVRTARNVIDDALRTIGVFAPGETPPAADTQTGLDYLQNLLAEWSDGGLVVPITVTEAVTLVVAQASYTIGESGSPGLNTVRPEHIIHAYVRRGGVDYLVDIIGAREYNSLPDKDTAGLPEYLFPLYAAPNMTIYLYPVPDAADSLYITSRKTFTEPTTLTEAILNTTGLPRNYYNALKFNLALELAPEYGVTPNAFIIGRAIETLSTLKALSLARTVEAVELDIMPGHRRFNIMEG